MKAGNRDLLVLSKNASLSDDSLKHELEILNTLLFNVENLHSFCTAHEIIDVNKYKVIKKIHLIQQIIREKALKPFVFIFNKN
ncbi:MAG: hypothetical protein ACOVNY_11395 [Chitinophagaceae bacterium]